MNRTKAELTHKLSEDTRQDPSLGPDLREAGSLLLGGESGPGNFPLSYQMIRSQGRRRFSLNQQAYIHSSTV